jgi:hypothetical protein
LYIHLLNFETTIRAMDPALRAAYEGGYGSRFAQHHIPKVIMATATATAEPVEKRLSEILRDKVVEATSTTGGNEVNFNFNPNIQWTSTFTSLISAIFRPFTTLFSLLWSHIILPYLIEPAFVLLLLLLILALTAIIIRTAQSLQRQGTAIRERLDENDYYAQTAHYWHSFNHATREFYLTMRWNAFTDRFALLQQEIRFFYDRVMGNMWWICGILVLVFIVDPYVRHESTVFVDWEHLPERLAGKEPEWVHFPRKFEGSNSHYRRSKVVEAEAEPVFWEGNGIHPQPIVDEDRIRLISEDEVFDLTPDPEVITVVSYQPTTEVVTFTETEDFQHTTETVTFTSTEYLTATETISIHQQATSMPEQPIDTGIPTSVRNTVEGMVWCKECQQYHCCEVPY